VPGAVEDADQVTDAFYRDDANVVEIGDRWAADPSRRPSGTSWGMPLTVVVISATMTFARYS